MECKDCKYNEILDYSTKEKKLKINICKISHLMGNKSCRLGSDKDVEKMDICFNCKHWLGGNDWGLSCSKNYYYCNSNGFAKACDKFDKKDNN